MGTGLAVAAVGRAGVPGWVGITTGESGGMLGGGAVVLGGRVFVGETVALAGGGVAVAGPG